MSRSVDLELEVDESEHVTLTAEEVAELEAETSEMMNDIAADFEALKLDIADGYDDEF